MMPSNALEQTRLFPKSVKPFAIRTAHSLQQIIVTKLQLTNQPFRPVFFLGIRHIFIGESEATSKLVAPEDKTIRDGACTPATDFWTYVDRKVAIFPRTPVLITGNSAATPAQS
jgi:hypothetical protein